MSFPSKKMLKVQDKEKKAADHIRDRRKMRRSTANIADKKKRR
uniref:Uncharacterized protein n=1 Tax=Romanomermis culicivorax TaxID=13658 RepID=A0A915IIK8_ROMCU